MKQIAIVLGTRPEAIKLIPLYLKFKESKFFNPVLISTGQHKEMLEQIFSFFNLWPDIELNVMSNNQGLSGLTSILFQKLEEVISRYKFDGIIVQGDTSTAMVGSMVCFYNKVKVIHIEAGLRTYDKFSPFPEEVNRRIIGLVADFHFAPTEKAAKALEKENLNGIYIVGNTVIDSLILAMKKIAADEEKYKTNLEISFPDFENKRLVLVTGHRRENFGKGFEEICKALAMLADKHKELSFVYPVHLNPNVRQTVFKFLQEYKNIHLIDPLPYDQLLYLMSKSVLILTDSGGIQEEAPSLNIPLIVMRDNTERPEGIEAGCAVLAGTTASNIVNLFKRIYEDQKTYNKMAQAVNPYGDGKSAERIVQVLEKEL
ncbi:UDP-N-acetylglucosamine 2-epimerase (non-hydrolyzing) [Adhaeribacter swui]|uniref:UDP-N-acetylglucosamine 2-epimerase (non-hydrolyzing) n=1 Tax=Adhaeribacter swui TaxID=2086471 RepID=A0A7G7G9I3_9BACT|nr:UDP-N-acetylglucosamine 2-epimerase (non-hydrolyzing) [Adhaeribacter swui]QNF33817.1 UDP-N-acetylglucosamine 2-epimerase (non-hydrolyzing) [Adhaeribacter swui]